MDDPNLQEHEGDSCDDEGSSNQAMNSSNHTKKRPYNNVENVDAKAMQLENQVFNCIHYFASEKFKIIFC